MKVLKNPSATQGKEKMGWYNESEIHRCHCGFSRRHTAGQGSQGQEASQHG